MTRRPPRYRRLVLIGCLAAAPALGADFQDIAQLEGLAKSAAAALLPPPTVRQRLQVGPIQPGLQLQRCGSGVQPGIAPGLRSPGRVLVELRCEGGPAPGAAWHIYVPVRLVGTSPVVLAAHALVAGTVLTAKDVTVEQRDITALPPGYLDDAGIAVGLTAGRAISGGSILTNQQLLGTKAVQRGQMVTLMADVGGIAVRMAGRALSDGLVNQRIRVENLSSGKVVEGIARSEQVVEIIFQ
ncbi:MAG TPA: flagellar basal body P-ring formation chaperone FlgA [Steroidobacteraceae bacterium]|nr:flagellar basal body P-ring formation chaperone FlgA [Steroidobacteraceae bacterium]